MSVKNRLIWKRKGRVSITMKREKYDVVAIMAIGISQFHGFTWNEKKNVLTHPEKKVRGVDVETAKGISVMHEDDISTFISYIYIERVTVSGKVMWPRATVAE